MFGSYRVWRNERRRANVELESIRLAKDQEIEALKAEMDLLRRRPYDEDHKRLVERKLSALSEVSKDLLWYLLHYGETEANELLSKCKHAPDFNDAVQRARDQGLVLDLRTGSAAQGTERYSWKINPNFEPVLRDLLGGRRPTFF